MPGPSTSGTWAPAAWSIAFCSARLWSSGLPARTPKCSASMPRTDSGAATARLLANGSVTAAAPTAEKVKKWRRSRDMEGTLLRWSRQPSKLRARSAVPRWDSSLWLTDSARRRDQGEQDRYAGAGQIVDRDRVLVAIQAKTAAHQRHVHQGDERNRPLVGFRFDAAPVDVIAQIGAGIVREPSRHARTAHRADQLVERSPAGQRRRLSRPDAGPPQHASA